MGEGVEPVLGLLVVLVVAVRAVEEGGVDEAFRHLDVALPLDAPQVVPDPTRLQELANDIS